MEEVIKKKKRRGKRGGANTQEDEEFSFNFVPGQGPGMFLREKYTSKKLRRIRLKSFLQNGCGNVVFESGLWLEMEKLSLKDKPHVMKETPKNKNKIVSLKELPTVEVEDTPKNNVASSKEEAVVLEEMVKNINKNLATLKEQLPPTGEVKDTPSSEEDTFVDEIVNIVIKKLANLREEQPLVVEETSETKKKNIAPFKEQPAVVEETSKKKKKKVSTEKQQPTVGDPNKIKRKKNKYDEYLSENEVKNGLEDGSLFTGCMRINAKSCPQNAFVTCPGLKKDIMLSGLPARNRALDGDHVVIGFKNGQAFVASILKKVNTRLGVGSLQAPAGKNNEFAVLRPRDDRLPSIKIPSISCPDGFKENPLSFKNILFMAMITNWEEIYVAEGMLVERLGDKGNLKVENAAILLQLGLDPSLIPVELRSKYLPKSKKISDKELSYRLDLRKECIFTVDPLTARDLDDALSIKELKNGNFEVGVHISDASFYLEEGSELDNLVRKRATTIYLVDSVHHMLPEEMCLFHSLLPGEDKLAFSVIWELTPQAEIVSTQFIKTVINSCTQLAYEHAQEIIDNPQKKNVKFPIVYNNFCKKDIYEKILQLNKLAVIMQAKQQERGSLKIGQVKLNFTLNALGLPESFTIQENKAANRMIEQFMLLANGCVAAKIEETYPHLAFLRRHDNPKENMLNELKDLLEIYGIHIEIESSKSLAESLRKYYSDDSFGKSVSSVLDHLVAKCMNRAQYFCSGPDENFSHYALNIPIYTHFTSPIRRYADMMVHRLLAGCLGVNKHEIDWTKDYVDDVAANCNRQKYNAKLAGEASSDLYLHNWLTTQKNYTTTGVVVKIQDRSIDVLVQSMGVISRIHHTNLLPGCSWSSIPVALDPALVKDPEQVLYKIVVGFPATRKEPHLMLILELFTMVRISLTPSNKIGKFDGVLLRPL